MKVYKVLNNNVLVTLDETNNELVVMGRGIGFKKKEGDLIDQSLIEKQFFLNNKEILPKFAELISSIPIEIIVISEIIINYAKSQLNGELHDSVYISLTDHINFAIERHKKGLDIFNNFLWETKKLYPKEFHIGKYALSVIKKRLNINLPEDEAGFITFHIINAHINDSMSNIINITKIVHEILNLVKYHFKFEYDENSLSYQRFITHLKFFAQRILNSDSILNQNVSLYDFIQDKYKESCLCSKKIKYYLLKKYKHSLTENENLYLVIHIERLRTELLKQNEIKNL